MVHFNAEEITQIAKVFERKSSGQISLEFAKQWWIITSEDNVVNIDDE